MDKPEKIAPGGIGSDTHVDYTNGQTCNCNACIEKRGFVLCTKPFTTEHIDVVFHKREPVKK